MPETQDDVMKLADLKAALAFAEKQPVNFAFALAADKSALLMVHKQTSPKILQKQLELKAKTADKKSMRFGRITVDPIGDPGTLKFATNKKEIGGTVVGLVKLAKRAGYQAVILSEDPSLEGGETATAQPTSAAQPAQLQPPQPGDWGTAESTLSDLSGKIASASGGNPMLQQPLVKLAAVAQTILKARQDFTAASAAIEELRRALAAAAEQAKLTQQAQSGGGPVTYAKSRLAWLAARQKVHGDIGRLRDAIIATYEVDGIGAELDKAFEKRVGPVLQMLNESLAEILDDATNESDPTKRAKVVADAKETIGDYMTFLNTDKTIAQLDANPFVPLSIRNTIAATLNTLAKAIR